ncbi:MAG: hypothetical protein MZV70_40605 [Desulfobacterales bacterium]|nr:hypothetical protein [Desulfobacterales bacterium]
MKEVVIVSGARTAVGEFRRFSERCQGRRPGRPGHQGGHQEGGSAAGHLGDDIKSFRPEPFGDFEMTEINKKYYDYDKALKPVYFDEVHHGQRAPGGPGPEPGPPGRASTRASPRRPTPSPSTRSAPPA